MKKIHNHILVQNPIAKDCLIAGVFEEVDSDFKNLLKSAQLNPKPLMVCSGGTSSRCAAKGHWTLDLRKKYQDLDFNPTNKNIEIGAGISMTSLLRKLTKHNRTFPIGLSGLPGLGYIITGGISPLSRSQGLAIDQIINITGVWGNGECFKICKPKTSSDHEEKLIWRGLCGAAPFLGIVTKLTLKTQPLTPLKIWQASIQKEHLIDAIQQAEKWPKSLSLQWIWGDQIKIYVVIETDFDMENQTLEKLQKNFPCSQSLHMSKVLGLQESPKFIQQSPSNKSSANIYSEVIGLLGPSWGNNCNNLINSLADLIAKRPNKHCYIAAQQLGGASSQISRTHTSFIHREAIWKPWINASWRAGDHKEKEKSLIWLKEAWGTLDPHCPGIHLAQMHQHLPWHKEETKKAFKEWLPGLQSLKSKFDPQGILPRL